MKRVLLDTNVYGQLILDKVVAKGLLDLIPVPLLIYGSEVVRAELRDVSKKEKVEDKSKRMLLLNLYDTLTQEEGRTYKTTPFIEILALQYFDEYSRLEGKKGYEELRKDFVIIATASIHGLDVVVSSDTKTMLSDEAKEAYVNVNDKNQLRTPQLLGYEELKGIIRRLRDERA